MPPVSHLILYIGAILHCAKNSQAFSKKIFGRAILLTNFAPGGILQTLSNWKAAILAMDQKQITAPDGGGRVEPRRDPPPRMPKNHLALAVLTTLFCCMPFGIISLVYAVQVNISSNSGNFEMAEFSSEKALFWGMVALWCGVALYILNSLFFLLPFAFV